MGPAGAVGRHLAAGRRAGPLGPRHPGLSAQPRAEHLPLSALRPRSEGAAPRGRSPDRSGLAQSSRSPGPVADPPGGRRVGRTPTTDLPKERQPRGRRYDQLSALRSQGPAREGRNAQEWRATEAVLRHRGGWRNPMALPVAARAVCGSAAHDRRTWCSLGHPARSGQPRMRTKVPSRDRRNCTRRADEEAEIHRSGPQPRRRLRVPPGSWPGPGGDPSASVGPRPARLVGR